MTLAGWQTLLSRLRERLDSLGVTLHEIEESAGGIGLSLRRGRRIGSSAPKPSSSSVRRSSTS